MSLEPRNPAEIPKIRELNAKYPIMDKLQADQRMDEWHAYRQEVAAQNLLRQMQFDQYFLPEHNLSKSRKLNDETMHFINSVLEDKYSIVAEHDKDSLSEGKYRERIKMSLEKLGDHGYQRICNVAIASTKTNATANKLAFELIINQPTIYAHLNLAKLDQKLDVLMKKSLATEESDVASSTVKKTNIKHTFTK